MMSPALKNGELAAYDVSCVKEWRVRSPIISLAFTPV